MKYGLYAAVLAGVVGATVAWAKVDKTVTLRVDGEAQKIHTVASSVRGVLTAAHFPISEHDVVAPGVDAKVHNGSVIVLRRGRLLHLMVDNHKRDIWVTTPTVADALHQLGYSAADFSSVSRDKRLPLSPTNIEVRSPKWVIITADGKSRKLTTTDGTVAQLLEDLGVSVGRQDVLSATSSSQLHSGERIVVTRIKSGNVAVQLPVPFPTTHAGDPTMYVGQHKLVKHGKDGKERVTYALVYVDGKQVGRTIVRRVLLVRPIAQVIKVGTKPKPGPPPIVVDPGSAQDIAKKLAAARGWGDDQFSCLYQIWSHESGWRVDAQNPSGAYGIPQALPGDKMAEYGSDWQSNPTTQIKWGLDYIAGRYSTPCGAWSWWQANGWY
ncbi:MAG TPA: ubiquitin-like domain-containing protein [Mycobacterium sp.]|nr:ubiquitin-like domain-containing protein [Mycobacterium sp.]